MIDGFTAQKISIDVGNNTPVEDSQITYGPEELKFRKQVEKEVAEYLLKNPGAILDAKD